MLIIDMQNGFCHPRGSFARIGMPTERQSSVIPNIRSLRDLCRVAGIPVVYTITAFNADYSDAGLGERELQGLQEQRGFVRGTWDSRVVDELQPGEDEIVVLKTRNNSFWRSALNQILASKGVEQILATGVATNICVESTVREARSYGYRALTVADGTATLNDEEQQASLTNLKRFGGTILAEELAAEIRSLGKRTKPAKTVLEKS